MIASPDKSRIVFQASALLIAIFAMGRAVCGQQSTVTYDLDDVWLLPDDTHPGVAAQQMTGRFVWTYTPGDFENGTADFTSLYIPFGGTSIGAVDDTVDTQSLEFTLVGNYHGLGLDVTLKLTTPFSEFLNAPVDLVLSKWEVENGITYGGSVTSGDVIPTCWSPENYGVGSPGSGAYVPTISSSGGEPRIGNSSFQIDSGQVLGGAMGILALGFGQTQIPTLGINLLVDPTNWILDSALASGTAGIPGAGVLQFPVPVPLDTQLIGMEIDFQTVVIDPGAPLGILSASDGLTMNLCDQ